MTHADHHHDNHHHHHKHHHHHVDISTITETRLWWAIGANILLTFAQVIGGIISGSLSLIADALHNFSDAASLIIAMVAIRIGRRPADKLKTFGYKRAETIAALINLTTLVMIGLYLIFEAVKRFISPEPIDGWIIIIVAGIALVVDLFTAFLTYRASKTSMNIKAAFIHNMTDALASVGVIVAGVLIMLYGWVWVDAFITLLIAGYVLWHGYIEMPKVIHLLMDGTPDHINLKEVAIAIEGVQGVKNVHHLHVRQMNEHLNALEAHILIEEQSTMDNIKSNIKALLKDKFSIGHSTLEFEITRCE